MARGGRRLRNTVTISDVAREAGVSSMTVSRVVNAEKNVSEATRERVSAAIRQLNYAPNLAARNLAKAQDLRVGVVYSNPSMAFLSEVLLGLLDRAQEEGAQLLIVRCEDGEAEQEAVRRLIEGGVDGVILPPPHSESPAIRRAFREAGVTMAVVAAGRAPLDAICVRIDDRRAAYDMTRRLLELGHRRFGFVGGHPNQTSSGERLEGFKAALGEVEGAAFAFSEGLFDFTSGLAAAEALLDVPERPTAIFASNDDMAAAAVSVAHRRGLDVPRDLTVVGFDDTALALTLWPPLTTVRQPVRAMAAAAVELLVAAVRAAQAGERLIPADRVLAHDLVERQSSAPPPPPPRGGEA